MPSTPIIRDLEPIYYDMETSGVKVDRDRIIEIAAYDPSTDKYFAELVSPGITIPAEVQKITGIDDAMLEGCDSFAEVGKRFIDFCGKDAILVAHNNCAFDALFIEAEMKRSQLTMPSWQMFDTLQWARKYRPDLPSHSLQNLLLAYGIEESQKHRALSDVRMLVSLCKEMLDDLPISLALQLLEADPTQRMPFGKHRGLPLEQVPRDYVRWLSESGILEKRGNESLLVSFRQLGLIGER